jgi:hypothetical protein
MHQGLHLELPGARCHPQLLQNCCGCPQLGGPGSRRVGARVGVCIIIITIIIINDMRRLPQSRVTANGDAGMGAFGNLGAYYLSQARGDVGDLRAPGTQEYDAPLPTFEHTLTYGMSSVQVYG